MSQRIDVGDRHIVIHEHGEGVDPVVLVHSSGLGPRQWRRSIEALAPRYRVLVPELVGYGESSPVASGERIHFAMDLLALERLLDRLGTPAHLVGHSYGGFLALLLALHRPNRVRSVAVYEPVSFGVLRSENDLEALATLPSSEGAWPASSDELEAWLEGFLAYWNGPGAWQTVGEAMRATFRATAAKVVGEVRTLGQDGTPLEAYTTLPMPVLLLGGAGSTLAADRVLGALARAIPDARRVRLEGAGHMGPITHAAEVHEHLLRFLAGI